MKETKNRASFYDLTRKCGEMYKMVSLYPGDVSREAICITYTEI